MVSPTTWPRPRSAPRCEQCASSTATRPLSVRNATSRRPRIILVSGFFLSVSTYAKKYHDAGYFTKAWTGGASGMASRLLGRCRVVMLVLSVSLSLLAECCKQTIDQHQQRWQKENSVSVFKCETQ